MGYREDLTINKNKMIDILIAFLTAGVITIIALSVMFGFILWFSRPSKPDTKLKPWSVCKGDDGKYYPVGSLGEIINIEFDSYESCRRVCDNVKRDACEENRQAPHGRVGLIKKEIVCREATE